MTNISIKIALLKDKIITVEKDISFHNTQVERMIKQLEALQRDVETLEQEVQAEEDDETLSTKPWSHADDEVDNDR